MTGQNEANGSQQDRRRRSILGPLRGSPVLVSGATGFIGAHLVERLVEAGCDVTGLVRPGSSVVRIAHLLDRMRLVEADVTTLETGDLAEQVDGARVVFHLAAAGVAAADLDPPAVVGTNVIGTMHMLQTAQALGCERFVYCGSCLEYGAGERCQEDATLAPLGEYGASKAAGWLLTQAFSHRSGMPVLGLRPFNVYGPRGDERSLVPYVITTALQGGQTTLTAGKQRRDFVFVDDVVDGFVAAAVAGEVAGDVFNLCTGRAITVADLVRLAITLSGAEHEPSHDALAYRPTDVPVLTGDPTRAEQLLGWTASTPLRDGLLETIEWHRAELMCGAGAIPGGSAE